MMSELTPFERSLEDNTRMVAEAEYGPGLDVVLVEPDGTRHSSVTVGGAERPMRGLFEAPVEPVSASPMHSAAMSHVPVLHIQISLVQAALGRPLTTRDQFIVRGKPYRVQSPGTDGFGLVTCKLLEVSNA